MQVFTYGTLQIASVQKYLFNRVKKGRPAILLNYKRTGAVSMVRSIGDEVKGLIYDYTEAELEAADRYETMAGYWRINAIAENGEGLIEEVAIYVN